MKSKILSNAQFKESIKTPCSKPIRQTVLNTDEVNVVNTDTTNNLIKIYISFIKSNPNIESISFVKCNLKSSELILLLESLATLKNLKRLNLSGNSLEDLGTESIANYISKNPNLNRINLAHCNITDKGGTLIAGALKKNYNLTSINLFNNKFMKEALVSFSKAIEINHNITDINLKLALNPSDKENIPLFYEEHLQIIQKAMENNKVLIKKDIEFLDDLIKEKNIYQLYSCFSFLRINTLYTNCIINNSLDLSEKEQPFLGNNFKTCFNNNIFRMKKVFKDSKIGNQDIWCLIASHLTINDIPWEKKVQSRDLDKVSLAL